MKKKVVTGILLLFVLLLLTIGFATTYLFSFALDRKVANTDEEDSYEYLFQRDYLKDWVDSLRTNSALKDTFIMADDGAKLHALYVRSANESPNTALLVHGYTDNSIRMLMVGHIYQKKLDYNILLPDLRAHGKSDGEYIQMGWKDRLDVLRWIDVARDMYGDTTNMVIHGISMGAATTMMTSGEDLPDNVKCFVADCGFTSVWDEFAHQLSADFGLPSFPLLNTASWYCQMKEDWNFKEASAIEQVKKCKRPMFFIHGDADTYVPAWMVYKLHEAKNGEKELWVLPGVEHAKAYWDETEEYTDRVIKFTEKYIGE